LEALQLHERETRSIFAAERGRLENDCTKLREQLLQATAEVCDENCELVVTIFNCTLILNSTEKVANEREHADRRIREEKDRQQKLQEESAAELLRIKADMQQQVAKILIDAKVQ